MPKNLMSSGDLFDAALHLRQCAYSWEPEVMLLGNVTAQQIREICDDYLKMRLERGISSEPSDNDVNSKD